MPNVSQERTLDLPVIGTVLAVQANYYRVQLDGDGPQVGERDLLCTRRSRLKKLSQQVMVGDRVRIEEPDWQGLRGAIAQVFPRQTQLPRPPVANANQILLMFALAEPALDPQQLTRFLITAATTPLKMVLCLNKAELISPDQQERWRDRLREWGYEPTVISLYTQIGLTQLHHQLQNQLTVVAGPSGVGKSSLINHLIPQLDVRVGAVSDRWGQGRHTTRHVELFELPSGGLLADTPGFNQPQLDCSPQALVTYFPEATQRLAQSDCQFKDCLHRDEPNCVVRGNWERYPYYLDLLTEVLAHQAQKNAMANPESPLKLKTKQQGSAQYEPKLETKKYRRSSRRSQQQALQDLYLEAEDVEFQNQL
jgi:ribosome biogenesis GTPase